jgi:hypothetical protein
MLTSPATAVPMATPTSPSRTELPTWPTPQAAVISIVLRNDHLPALDSAMNGK